MKRSVLLVALVFAIGVCAPAVQADPKPAASSSAGAEAYYQWMLQCLDGLEQDMDNITASAEVAADLYVNKDYNIATWGDPGFTSESYGRSGGLMRMLHPSNIVNTKSEYIVLMVLREDRWDRTIAKVKQYNELGRMVVGFASKDLIDRARKDGAKFDAWVNNHAAPHDGLFEAGDRWVVPTSLTGNIIAQWVWTGEFVSACTRLGKMPPIFQGFAVSGGRERAKRIGYRKFHDEVPTADEPGRVAREFIRETREDLKKVYENEMGDIRDLAELAVDTAWAGDGVYAFVHGHAIMQDQLGAPHDPGYFTQLNAGWFDQREDITLDEGDLVFCVGFDVPFHGRSYKGWDDKARAAGATLAWSFTGYKSDQVESLPDDEIFIDQHWDFGDAAVRMPGYDIKVLPTSGVIAEAVVWMTEAEILKVRRGRGLAAVPETQPAETAAVE